MDSSSPQWASLGIDLLSKIAKCLDTSVDILRFSAVCYSWRSSIPPPPKIPSPCPSLKLPFAIGPNPCLNPNRRGYFLLIESTIYALQPLTKISDSCKTTKTWLIKIEESKSGKVLNFLDYRVDETSKAHGLKFVDQGKAPELDFNELKSTTMIKKVVTSSNLDKIGDGFAIMALHTAGKLGVWRMGDTEWHNINDNRERSHYYDIVYHKWKFYALDFTGLVLSVDPATLKLTEFSPVMYGSCYGYGVYKLDEEKHDWVQMEGLDNRVLFVGDDRSLFWRKDGTYGPLAKFPGYSKIFWPPPTWLKSKPRELPRQKVNKVIVYPDFAWNKIEDCTVLAITEHGRKSGHGRLCYWRFGDENWTIVNGGFCYYCDIIVYKGQFYVVDKWGMLSVIDFSSSRAKKIAAPLYREGIEKFLVESCGDLYLVDGFVKGECDRQSNAETHVWWLISEFIS
ncbi:hypothetical protein GH714_034809 [Hevea brasiliensis]|uniref:HTH cro/C1-type domain-containing protein n=1 Tax=Hevea brasiliensis TaxID=3981 RepID=A0A6A6MK11_HEVBR|nr:hypothetical protein GH714_034809 [Hevea brasiliensis]